MPSPLETALRSIDREAILAAWQRISAASGVDTDYRRGEVPRSFTSQVVYELDVVLGPNDDLPPQMMEILPQLTEYVGSSGATIHLLTYLPHAVNEALAIAPQAIRYQLRVHAHVLIEKCIVTIASVGLRSLDDEAHRDVLTGLWNKRAYERDLRAKFSSGESVGLTYADIDGLKLVNDRDGHDAGDQMICDFASALERHCAAQGLKAYRWGGDEHAVLSDAWGVHRASALMSLVRDDFPSFSWGYAESSAGDADARSLLERADTAMYEQKQARKSDRTAAMHNEREDGGPSV